MSNTTTQRIGSALRRTAVAGTLAAAAAGFLGASATANAATVDQSATSSSGYTFRTLNDHTDPTFNQLLGINDHRVIAGYFGSGTPAGTHPNKGYTLGGNHDQDNYRNENFPGSQQTQVVGINNNGTTVGFWADASGANFGFVKDHGSYTSVSNPASNATPRVDQLLGVNNHQVAVGFYTDANGDSHGYIYNVGTHRFTPVLVPGASSVVAAGINDAGHIAGFAVINGNTEAFLLEGNHMQLTELAGSTNTQAFGINNADEIVGSYVDAAGNTHGFLRREHRTPTTIDAPHAAGTTVINGLNNHGQLVGFYTDAAGNTDGLLATVK